MGPTTSLHLPLSFEEGRLPAYYNVSFDEAVQCSVFGFVLDLEPQHSMS